jgi:hypothetical protein
MNEKEKELIDLSNFGSDLKKTEAPEHKNGSGGLPW